MSYLSNPKVRSFKLLVGLHMLSIGKTYNGSNSRATANLYIYIPEALIKALLRQILPNLIPVLQWFAELIILHFFSFHQSDK